MKKTLLLSSIIIIGLLAYVPSITAAESIPEPIAFWNFSNQAEVSAGLVSDIIGQYDGENNNGTWINEGYDGGGIKFSCSNCTLVTPSLPINNEITLLFRMKASDMANATTQRTIYTAYESHAYIFGGAANDPNEVNKITTAQMGNFTVSDDNNWHHYAFTWDGNGKHSYYKDGILTGYATGPGIQNMGGQITFGMGTESTTPTINLDEIKIYDQTLTAEQIAEESVNNKLLCKRDTWSCGDWGICTSDGQQTKTCTKTYDCEFVETPSPSTTQGCTYIPPTCTSWNYSNWSSCSESGQQTRSVTSSSPENCTGGNPVLSQSCTYVPPTCTSWTYSDWSSCSANGQKTRSVLTSAPTSCTGGSPVLTQSCTYTPPAPTCTTDTWECEGWNSCSPSGIQSRSCTKTFDCPSAQTASPATDQFCSAPKPPQTAPSQSDEISNQDIIVKSTVKLLCPVDEYSASQGSGTVIDSSGTILTNKHVVTGTLGCLIGFIDDFDDEPYFGERQIADIIKTSPTEDIAVLRIRNPKNKKLSYFDTTKNVSNFLLGTKITTYGYPAQFGTNITYTSGDFSGTDGNYLKTTAILEYGNSGGGAYLKNGTYIGIPSAVNKGELNALGYILSINTINAWLENSSIAFSGTNNNQYSRVSVLEEINLDALDSLNLFIPKTDEAGNITAPAQIGFFPDVPETHPNSVAIEVLRERNIISGYPDGTFKPENTVNRAELLKILVEGQIGKPDESQYKNCFPDVTTEWFAPYVCYAKTAGWVQGYPDGKFKPEQTVNKVEALKMLINSQGIATTETITSKPFNDVSTTDWFAKYVTKAKEMAILEETGSTFSPGEGMKRAGISENLYRLLIQ